MTVRKAAYILLVLSGICHLSSVSAHAETTYSSGTGFYVSRDGMVVTNNHVVKDCNGELRVSGAVALSDATLVARDETYDLALLRANATPPDIASLNNARQPLKADDPVVIVGYPGQSWETGERVTREAHILDVHGPLGEEKWLQFSDALVAGNSGGPLLDAAANVVGVVAGKATVTHYDDQTGHQAIRSQSDIAISLPVLRQFLDSNNVQYQTADSGIYLSADRVADKAAQFVVNVRCRVGNP